jgi:AsmA protein
MKSPWMRRVALVLGALLLLLALTAAVLVATFDANRYKTLAVDWMKTEHQRELAIDGPIELSVFPRLAVKVSRVRLSEHGRADEFLRVDEAALAVQVMPLLAKQLVVERISAHGVHASYRRDAQGVRNIDDLVSAPGVPQGQTREPASAAPALRLDISAVQLDDLRLRVDDQRTGLAGDVVLETFSSGRLSSGARSPVALRATVQLTRPQALKLRLDGRTTLALDMEKGAVALSDLSLDLAVESTGAKGQQGAESVELSLGWPELAADARGLKGRALSGKVKIDGAMALTGDFRAAALGGNFDALHLSGLELTLAGSAGPRKIDASVKADLQLDAGRSALAVEALDLRARLADPGLPALQLTLQGRAGVDAKAAQWKFAGALNTNKLETHGRVALGGAVPTVQASARFDDLDLNKLLPPEMPGAAAGTPATGAESPLPFDALKTVDGEFGIDAGALEFRRYKVAEATLAASLNGGVLRVSHLSGRAWGGRFEADGSAEAAGRRVALKLDASGVNVNALLRDIAHKDLLEGTGHVAADLHSSGASVAALRSNLAGTAALQLRDGAIKGFNLARSMRQAKAALSLKQDAVTQARATEKTDFSEMSASARIAAGVAQSDDLQLKSPFLRLGGEGRFDIGRGRIDYTARATVVAAATGQDGGDFDALRGVTVPVRLSGPFEAIDWKIQWSEVATAAVKARIQDKLTEALRGKLGAPPAGGAAASAAARPEDRLKGQLKGLFK